MDLREALTQISQIRQHVARGETFRGYKALPVAFSGLAAIAAGVYQAVALPEPQADLIQYLHLWIFAAILSLLVTGIALWVHCRESVSPLTRPGTLLAIGQFAPCLVAGGLTLFVLWNHAPECLWLMPGLWCILFGLGVFASSPLMPRAIFWVGVHYFVAGAFCLAWARGEHAFSPWAMALPFGAGQLITAGILYWTLERNHGEQEAR